MPQTYLFRAKSIVARVVPFAIPAVRRVKPKAKKFASRLLRVFRGGLLAGLALLHAPQRSDARMHRMPGWRFVWRVLCRYADGVGKEVTLDRPIYITQKARQFLAKGQLACGLAPAAHAWLFFANVLKVQGFFEDAEIIYRKLRGDPRVADVAVAGLGDLVLLQAMWANEFSAYEPEGLVLNLFRGEPTAWHQRTYAEAITLLKEAAHLNPAHADIWWLLACAYLAAGKWEHALASLCECEQLGLTGPEQKFAEARARFCLDSEHGVRTCKDALGSWHGWWEVSEAKIIEKVHGQETGPAATLTIASNVALHGEVHRYESELRFDPPQVNQYEHAEVLPLFGMILANRHSLIGDSVHHKRCHWPLFTTPIYAIADDRAMINRIRGTEYPESGCVYIGHNNNYYHWLLDVLPRLSPLQGRFDDAPVLVDKDAAPWQLDLLRRLGYESMRLRTVDFSTSACFKSLIAPSHLSRDMVAHPEAVKFMRGRLVPHADTAVPRAGKRLYLTRASPGARRTSFLNERNLVEKFERAGFAFVDTGAMTIDQQIDLFSDAEVIVAPGGAAVTNILFAPAKAKVLTLAASDVVCETFTSIACAIGQESWCCAGTSYARPHPAWIWTVFDFEIDDRDLDLCFDRLL